MVLFENEKYFFFDLLQIGLTLWWMVIVIIAIYIIEKIAWWKSIIVSIMTATVMLIAAVIVLGLPVLLVIGFAFISVLMGGGI